MRSRTKLTPESAAMVPSAAAKTVRETAPGPAHPILVELLSLPTAPFAEDHVIRYVREFCKARGVEVRADRAGNLLLHIKRGRRTVARPVCFTAHMDHPGFLAETMVGEGQLLARWRGGVWAEYFVGARVRFFVEGRWVKGVIRSIDPPAQEPRKPVETAIIEIGQAIPPGSIGMWDFPDPHQRGPRLFARGCDCVAGVASLMCCLDELVSAKKNCDVYFLLTRAEEVGFVGAIAASRAGTIPKKCVVVAVETSSELPSAPMGEGPILRVGDKTSTFTPAATAFCQAAARDLADRDPTFTWQRKLMDGGTCESTAYCQFGYEATGICIALGHYHNIDKKRGRIAPEYIDLGDFDKLVRWFVELASGKSPYDPRNLRLTRHLEGLEKQYAGVLKTSAGRLARTFG